MGHADACRIIYAGSGTQFDPRVVDAFRAVQSEFERILQEYRAQQGK
jgi:response regulator RpfG family c-di-GMP phosphodiesterase